MKKSDLKELIKPLVKECIHEVLIEEGLLSNVVSEVAKGMQGNLVTETTTKPTEKLFNDEMKMNRRNSDGKKKIEEHRRKLMEAMGRDAYNGVDIFEGVEPMAAQREIAAGSVDLGHPSDAGVDISSILGQASQVWKAMK